MSFQENRKPRLSCIKEKYQESSTTVLEYAFQKDTVGLISAEEYKKKRQKLAETNQASIVEELKSEKSVSKVNKKTTKNLSFESSDEGDSSECQPTKILMKPDITAVVKNKDTQNIEIKEGDEMKVEQDIVKGRSCTIYYTYWDGLEYHREEKVTIGDTIGCFLKKCYQSLTEYFKKTGTMLRPIDELMYVKDQIIIPHNITFYELLLNEAKGANSKRLFSENNVNILSSTHF